MAAPWHWLRRTSLKTKREISSETKEKCMSLSTKKILFPAMALIFLLSACQPAQPTQNPSDVADQVATSVALTVAAQNALTQAAPSLVPEATNTTLPTQTEVGTLPSPTPVLPTVTAVVLSSPKRQIPRSRLR